MAQEEILCDEVIKFVIKQQKNLLQSTIIPLVYVF